MLVIIRAGTVAVMITAVVNDVRNGKIPNVLLISLLTLQIVSEILSLFLFGVPVLSEQDVVRRYLSSAFIVFSFYPFYLIGELGAGDIKLLGIAALSLNNQLGFVFLSFAVGACMAIGKFVLRGICRKSIIHLSVPMLISYLVTVFIYG